MPLITFVLGANLSNGTGDSACGVLPRRFTAAVLVSKLAIVPAINLALVVGALRVGLLPEQGSHGLLPLSLLVIGASPTAMNISAIATMQGTSAKEVSLLLFYQYCIAIITMSVFASVGLALFL